jgi:hypothetical protein
MTVRNHATQHPGGLGQRRESHCVVILSPLQGPKNLAAARERLPQADAHASRQPDSSLAALAQNDSRAAESRTVI